MGQDVLATPAINEVVTSQYTYLHGSVEITKTFIKGNQRQTIKNRCDCLSHEKTRSINSKKEDNQEHHIPFDQMNDNRIAKLSAVTTKLRKKHGLTHQQTCDHSTLL